MEVGKPQVVDRSDPPDPVSDLRGSTLTKLEEVG